MSVSAPAFASCCRPRPIQLQSEVPETCHFSSIYAMYTTRPPEHIDACCMQQSVHNNGSMQTSWVMGMRICPSRRVPGVCFGGCSIFEVNVHARIQASFYRCCLHGSAHLCRRRNDNIPVALANFSDWRAAEAATSISDRCVPAAMAAAQGQIQVKVSARLLNVSVVARNGLVRGSGPGYTLLLWHMYRQDTGLLQVLLRAHMRLCASRIVGY